MYKIYSAILIIAAIIFSPIMGILFIAVPKLRAGFKKKIGLYNKNNSKNPTIWFHAVSVGETNAIETLVFKTKEKFPNHNIAITTVTKTGQELAQKKFAQIADIITYFPYDFDFSVKNAIKAINPQVVIIAETEIWPNFSKELNKKNIPLLLVNGRISPNSYKNYKKFSFIFKNILKNYSSILMQTQEDKKRIIDIGAGSSIVEVMGNLKFDIEPALDKEAISSLKDSFCLDDNKLIIAGSTHKGEDEIILNSYKSLKEDSFKNLKMLLAPRHPERLNQVKNLLEASGFSYGLRSVNDTFKNNDIILVDTMGELSNLYAISNVAFIGGSFSNTGGHNPLEPAIYGVPTVSGPTVFNFKDIFKYMTELKAAFIANNQSELTNQLKELLTNQELYLQAEKACIDIFKHNKGALNYCLNCIKLESFLTSTCKVL